MNDEFNRKFERLVNIFNNFNERMRDTKPTTIPTEFTLHHKYDEPKKESNVQIICATVLGSVMVLGMIGLYGWLYYVQSLMVCAYVK